MSDPNEASGAVDPFVTNAFEPRVATPTGRRDDGDLTFNDENASPPQGNRWADGPSKDSHAGDADGFESDDGQRSGGSLDGSFDVAAEIAAIEALGLEFERVAAEQAVRRAELEAYLADIKSRRDNPHDEGPSNDGEPAGAETGGDLLVEWPEDFGDLVSEASAALASADGGVDLPSLASFVSDASFLSETLTSSDPVLASGVLRIAELDRRLADIDSEARRLKRAAKGRSGGGEDSLDTSSIASTAPSLRGGSRDGRRSQRSGRGGAPSSRSRSLYGVTDSSGGYIERNIEGLRNPLAYYMTEEEAALAEEVLARDDDADAAISVAYALTDEEASRLADIDQRLADRGVLDLDLLEGEADDLVSQISVSTRVSSRTDTGIDYVRAQRVNREQRDKLRQVEMSLRELAIQEDVGADEGTVKQLLRIALAEASARGEDVPTNLELLSADEVSLLVGSDPARASGGDRSASVAADSVDASSPGSGSEAESAESMADGEASP